MEIGRLDNNVEEVGEKERKSKKSRIRMMSNRVVINKEANRVLEDFIKKVSMDDESMQVTKSDVANYVFVRLNNLINETDIKNLKTLKFDEKKVLQKLLRGVQDSSELPEEIKKVLRDYCGISDKDKKRHSKINTIGVLDSAEPPS